MKVLMRDHGAQQLVYITATYKNGKFYDEYDRAIYPKRILDIARDNRKNTVVCSNCGELIKNTPEAIEKHWKEKAKNKNCLECEYLRERNRSLVKKTIKPDPNNENKFIVTTKTSANVYCGFDWREPNINSEDAERYCKHMRCKHAGRTEFTDFFLENPHAFDVLPTVDALVQKRWKLIDYTGGNYLVYAHPRMTTLTAYVNSKGVVTEFNLNKIHSDYSVNFMYSKRYDKIVFMDGTKYYLNAPWFVRENLSKMNSAIEKVKELF